MCKAIHTSNACFVKRESYTKPSAKHDMHLVKNRHYAHDSHAHLVLVCYSIPEPGKKVSQDKMCVVHIETELSMKQNIGIFRISSIKKIDITSHYFTFIYSGNSTPSILLGHL